MAAAAAVGVWAAGTKWSGARFRRGEGASLRGRCVPCRVRVDGSMSSGESTDAVREAEPAHLIKAPVGRRPLLILIWALPSTAQSDATNRRGDRIPRIPYPLSARRPGYVPSFTRLRRLDG